MISFLWFHTLYTFVSIYNFCILLGLNTGDYATHTHTHTHTHIAHLGWSDIGFIALYHFYSLYLYITYRTSNLNPVIGNMPPWTFVSHMRSTWTDGTLCWFGGLSGDLSKGSNLHTSAGVLCRFKRFYLVIFNLELVWEWFNPVKGPSHLREKTTKWSYRTFQSIFP